MKVADEAKFLGLVFDSRLTLRAHVKYLKTVCGKALNVLRVVGHTTWSADKVVLSRLYRALVHSKLYYGYKLYMALRVGLHWEHWMQFTMQVYAFVWELFVLRLCKVSMSKRHGSILKFIKNVSRNLWENNTKVLASSYICDLECMSNLSISATYETCNELCTKTSFCARKPCLW